MVHWWVLAHCGCHEATDESPKSGPNRGGTLRKNVIKKGGKKLLRLRIFFMLNQIDSSVLNYIFLVIEGWTKPIL
jgi:hypothetical protein